MHMPLHEAVLTLLGYALGIAMFWLVILYMTSNGIDCYNACP